MESRVYKRKVDTRDELLAHILDVAARIKKPEKPIRTKTSDLRTRFAKCNAVETEIFEYLC